MMKKNWIYKLILLACMFILPGNVMADEGWGPGQDKWKFNLGAFFFLGIHRVKIDYFRSQVCLHLFHYFKTVSFQ